MEKEEFVVPNAEEMLKLMQEIMSSGAGLTGDDDEVVLEANPGKLLLGVDALMSKVDQLMQKVDQIEDDSEELDFNEFFEPILEESESKKKEQEENTLT